MHAYLVEVSVPLERMRARLPEIRVHVAPSNAHPIEMITGSELPDETLADRPRPPSRALRA